MAKSVYMYSGSIYCDATGGIIERPAILINPREDMLIAYGDEEHVSARFDKYRAASPELASEMVLIGLSNGLDGVDGQSLTRKEQCYVMRRAIDYTLSGFITKLYEHLVDELDDSRPDHLPPKYGQNVKEWIASEMVRLPIDLY